MEKLRHFTLEVFKIDFLRQYYCWARYQLLKKRLRILPEEMGGVGEDTIKHNLSALEVRAGFGMGNRMSILLYPLAAILGRRKHDSKVLIVCPRTEDDIYWARALGIMDVRGLDLFTYSPWIDLGDIHQTTFSDGEFDVCACGRPCHGRLTEHHQPLAVLAVMVVPSSPGPPMLSSGPMLSM